MLAAKILHVSMNKEDRIMVRFAIWGERESFVHISVCGIKEGGLEFVSPLFVHLTCW